MSFSVLEILFWPFVKDLPSFDVMFDNFCFGIETFSLDNTDQISFQEDKYVVFILP